MISPEYVDRSSSRRSSSAYRRVGRRHRSRLREDLLLLAVLKGSVLFLSDLMRRIAVPHCVISWPSQAMVRVESSGVVGSSGPG
jgi:hypothetical protein